MTPSIEASEDLQICSGFTCMLTQALCPGAKCGTLSLPFAQLYVNASN
jgi:hypothetical protein